MRVIKKGKRLLVASVILLAGGGIAVRLSRLLPMPAVPEPNAPPVPLVRPARQPAQKKMVYLERNGDSANASISQDRQKGDESSTEDDIPGEYALTFFNRRDREAFEALAAQYGIRVIDRLAAANALRIAVPDRQYLRDLLNAAPAPVTQLPNIHVRLPPLPQGPAAQAPTTPYTGFGTGVLDWLGAPAPEAEWGSGVRVAVLDTGIPSDFSGRVAAHLDLTGDGDGQAMHGGAVASLINGLQGMAPGAELLDIKVLPDSGTGDAFTLAKGIIEAVDLGAGVINISAGTRGDSRVLQAAVAYALERDVLLVAAAGNDGLTGINYPAGYEGVVAVGGVDANGRHLFFSNTGDALDLSAPGIGIAVPAAEGDGVQAFSGTSAASPLVAAAAALLRSESPELDSDGILALLQRYSNDTGAPGKDAATGAGTLNAGRLLARLEPDRVDMAAIRPFIRHEGERVYLDVFGQNQGTVTLPVVDMEITLDGRKQELKFNYVGVGDSTVHTLELPADRFYRDGVDITIHLRPGRIPDASPNNNALRAVILPQDL